MTHEEVLEKQLRATAVQAAIAYYCCRFGGGGGVPDEDGELPSLDEWLEDLTPLIAQFLARFLAD